MNFNRLDFVGKRKIFFIFSITVSLLGILSLSIFGLNFGVDFSAGTSLDIVLQEDSMTQEEARELFDEAVPGNEAVLTIGGEDNERISARFIDVLEDEQRAALLELLTDQFGEDGYDTQESTADPVIALELGKKAIYAVLIASIGIIIYVSIRFEWRFAITAIIALLHDAFFVISLFSIFQLEVNLPFVAAVLTIIGYSINDTIIIFDRIRENLRTFKFKKFEDLAELVNQSIRQTLVRSINTSLTVIFVALMLLLFGSQSIQLFSLALLLGLIVGAYSSIFIASQLWMLMKHKALLKQQQRNLSTETES